VLERHSDMAETSRALFTVLTLVFGALLFAPAALKKTLPRLAEVAGMGLFLALYGAAAIYLGQTAHQGGLLVHQFGVHAHQGPAAAAGAAQAQPFQEKHHDRN
jgi:hypothetical protein